MIKKIVLENFMSHKRTVIEPAEGLTVLTGPNNCGKSAVVVALQALCQNERSSKSFIRHHTKEARVVVETSEGHRLEWSRGKDVSYRIDGRDVHRLRGSLPDDLHEKLRLPLVEVPNGDPVDIHFSEQKDPIFLVNDKGGGRAARFFSAASDAALLLQMQQRHKAKVADQRSEERVLLGQIDASRKAIERFEGFAAIEADCTEVEKQYSSLSAKLASANQLYVLREAMVESESRAGLQHSIGEALGPLEAPPTLEDGANLEALCDHIEARAAAAQRHEETGRALDGLSPAPTMADLEEIRGTIDRLGSQATRVENCRKGMEEAAAALAFLEREIREFVQENPSCPICGGPMDAAKVMGSV